ncbi:MAG: NCS2 family permease [Candidatus Omnitrophota bacterium]
MLENWFHLSENNTTMRREVVGGIVTFLTMSYIIFVQPVMLQTTGMDFGAVMTATCLSSALATFIMGVWANYPVALAPGMGHNAFFAFIVCGRLGISWQAALGALLISGLLFLLLGAYGIRSKVMNAIPDSLKFGIAVGIGLMIALTGFEWAGVVVDDPNTLVSIGVLTNPSVVISGLGLMTALILTCWRARGAILAGMAVSAMAALAMGLISYKGAFSMPPSLAPTFLALRPQDALALGVMQVIFVFFILDLFDTIGTLVGVAELGGFMRGGELPRARQAFMSDAIGTVSGAVLGTSTVTSYVESCAGIGEGARTGLASVVTSVLFLLALFFYPLVEMLGKAIEVQPGMQVYPIIAPALIMVGFMMMRGVKFIPWDEPTDSIPAFLTIMLIAFSFSITEGIAFGFMSYTLLKIFTGRWRDLNLFLLVISVIFAFRYFYLSI